MSIIHVRIDDRLIHGQVATMWTNTLNTTRILVIDDDAAFDDVKKMSLKLATPSGVSLSVLPISKAAQRLKENAYEGQRVFVIIKSPSTLYQVNELGIKIEHANIGNLTFEKDRKKITPQVAVSDEEYEMLKVLKTDGLEISIQLIPSNPKKDFFEVAKPIMEGGN